MQIITLFFNYYFISVFKDFYSKMYRRSEDLLPKCATCKENVGTDFLSSQVAFVKGCSCSRYPVICHPCRSKPKKDDELCRWCHKKGKCWTIRPKQDPGIWKDTIPCARNWFDFREIPNPTQQVTKYQKCWTKFVNLFGMNQSPTPTMLWLNAQMFFNEPRLPVVYSMPYRAPWQRQSFVLQMMSVSFARTLACRFLNESGNHVMFRQGYCRKFLPFFQQKMFAKILRHVISNIVHLHELSIDLHSP